jgi:biotin carboxyl carrier protein
MKYFVTLPSGREHQVDIQRERRWRGDRQSRRTARTGHRRKSDLTSSGRGATAIRIGERSVELWLEGAPPKLGVIADGQRFFASVESERMRIRAASKPAAGGEEVKSPMPGRVVRVLVKEGDEVETGAPVIVVEAMKMESSSAPRAGKIKKVHVAVGATVESGTLLVEID